jgi:predicted Fe-S protein YdhL (DUF1289 family)
MVPPRLVAHLGVQSPCTGVCQLDGHDLCAGCFRTLDEIARWAGMTEGERAFVLVAVGKRKGAAYGSRPDSGIAKNIFEGEGA